MSWLVLSGGVVAILLSIALFARWGERRSPSRTPEIKKRRESTIGMTGVAGIVALVVVKVVVFDDRPEQPMPVSSASMEHTTPSAARHQEQSSTAESSPKQIDNVPRVGVPTPSEARAYIADLDLAMDAGIPILRNGDLAVISKHSAQIKKLAEAGSRFGSSVFEKPYGLCRSAGIHAQSWWHAELNVVRNGKECIPGDLKGAFDTYSSSRSSCLEAANSDRMEVIETERVVSSSPTPPRLGCLSVLGVKADGTVGVVEYTCPKQ